MKNQVLILWMLFMISCKQQKFENDRQPSILDSLGYEDYREIVRHPVSLQNGIDSSNWSEISFKNKEVLFDTITSGEKTYATYHFSNSGSKPLYILDTKVSCGCTIVDYPKVAIAPGGEGEINIEFNSTGKSGYQTKSVLVLSNSISNEDRLYLQGFVKNEKK